LCCSAASTAADTAAAAAVGDSRFTGDTEEGDFSVANSFVSERKVLGWL
jgi:hypothetical protein